MPNLILTIIAESWALLLDASVYILFGILLSGILKAFLNPNAVARHLGTGRFSSVIKAALFGIPLPLCSCGVLPAAASLQKQGANKGATTAFLISTPESGVDSITISYALLDPIMTISRPVAAFVTAIIAGFIENLLTPPAPAAAHNKNEGKEETRISAETSAASDQGIGPRIIAGFKYALIEVWGDIAFWFFGGLIIAGGIMALVPDALLLTMLDGGFSSMLVMLAVGIPLYICATASTPIAAALILKGVSPGAALVFLLAGPATNITTISVLTRILGKKSTIRYLVTLSLCAILFGLAVDQLYQLLGISPQAVIGEAAELIPYELRLSGALLLIILSIRPFAQWIQKKRGGPKQALTFHSGFPDIPSSLTRQKGPATTKPSAS